MASKFLNKNRTYATSFYIKNMTLSFLFLVMSVSHQDDQKITKCIQLYW